MVVWDTALEVEVEMVVVVGLGLSCATPYAVGRVEPEVVAAVRGDGGVPFEELVHSDAVKLGHDFTVVARNGSVPSIAVLRLTWVDWTFGTGRLSDDSWRYQAGGQPSRCLGRETHSGSKTNDQVKE